MFICMHLGCSCLVASMHEYLTPKAANGPLGLHVGVSHPICIISQPIPDLISCAGVTGECEVSFLVHDHNCM